MGAIDRTPGYIYWWLRMDHHLAMMAAIEEFPPGPEMASRILDEELEAARDACTRMLLEWARVSGEYDVLPGIPPEYLAA